MTMKEKLTENLWVGVSVEDQKTRTAARVPVFVKQIELGGKVEKDIDKFPKHLQVREFPVRGNIYENAELLEVNK